MVTIDKARIAHYDNNGNTFEIYVDSNLALEIKENPKKEFELSDLLAMEEVYKDARKGDKTSEKTLLNSFGTIDLVQIVREILIKGRLDLTTDQKKLLYQKKRSEIILYIVRNSINLITKAPHTRSSVEFALDKSKVEIDVNKSTESQIDKIITAIKPILPMSFQVNKCKVSVASGYGGKVGAIISKYDVVERRWAGDKFICVVNVPVGLRDKFLSTVSGVTQGTANVEIE